MPERWSYHVVLPDQWHKTQRKPQLDVDDEDEGEGD